MSDQEFERRLERMFAQPLRVSDGDAFARRVETRLERRWGARGLLVAVAGALGAFIAANQLVDVQVMQRLEDVSLPSTTLARARLEESWASGGLTEAAMTGEVVWLTAAMLGLAFAFAATRWAEG